MINERLIKRKEREKTGYKNKYIDQKTRREDGENYKIER